MTLTERLKVQAERVRHYRERKEWEAIDQAAGPATRQAKELGVTLQRLATLATVPTELAVGVDAPSGEIRTNTVQILEWWDTWFEGGVSVANIAALQSQLQGANSAASQHVRDTIRTTRVELGRLANDARDAEFLAGELGVDSPSMASIRAELRGYLEVLGRLLDGQDTGVPGGWESLRDRYREQGSPRACMLQASFPAGVADLVARLLERGELPLTEVGQEALGGLLRSPVLIRFCHIGMLKEGKE